MSEIHNKSGNDSADLLGESAMASPDGVSHSGGVEIQASAMRRGLRSGRRAGTTRCDQHQAQHDPHSRSRLIRHHLPPFDERRASEEALAGCDPGTGAAVEITHAAVALEV